MFDLQGGRDGPVTDLKIGYVGGGSQGWAHTLMNDLARCPDLGGEVALYDLDHAAAERNARVGNKVVQAHPGAVAEWTYAAHEDLADALAGADFVVISTQDPPAETFCHDLDLPREYGIYQTVGDTVGPGGTFRALRSIPQYREIAAAIREACPDAWVINYTNPMTVCTRTLYEEYPEINAVGLCHEIFGVQGLFADLIAEHLDADRPDRSEIDLNVTGINHFTWVDEATWRGRDLTPLLDEELAARESPPRFSPGDVDDASYFVDNDEVTLELYRRFGVLPAAGDRHLAEFVPWFLDVDAPEEVQRWGIRLTPSEYRVGDDDGPSAAEAYLAGDREYEFEPSGEEAVDVMRAILGLEAMRTNVNVPNRGQAPDLETGAVVETNAEITGDAVRPITAGPLPAPVRALIERHVANQETLIEAGFAGDLDLAFQAFLSDPLVTLQPDAARTLFADLVEAERDYLTDYDLEGAAVTRA